MPRRLGPGLLLATALAAAAAQTAWTQGASAQVASGFDGQYVGALTLVEVIAGDCATPPLGAVYPLTVAGDRVSFAYVPRFATTLTGSVAANGSFKASARTKHGYVEMTGEIRGSRVSAQIVSPSCLYNFASAY
jgi:hypothetical protein